MALEVPAALAGWLSIEVFAGGPDGIGVVVGSTTVLEVVLDPVVVGIAWVLLVTGWVLVADDRGTGRMVGSDSTFPAPPQPGNTSATTMIKTRRRMHYLRSPRTPRRPPADCEEKRRMITSSPAAPPPRTSKSDCHPPLPLVTATCHR